MLGIARALRLATVLVVGGLASALAALVGEGVYPVAGVVGCVAYFLALGAVGARRG